MLKTIVTLQDLEGVFAPHVHIAAYRTAMAFARVQIKRRGAVNVMLNILGQPSSIETAGVPVDPDSRPLGVTKVDLTPDQVAEILASDAHISVLAQRYGVAPSAIHRCRKDAGLKSNRRLTQAETDAILASDAPGAEIAEAYGISRQAVAALRKKALK